MIMEANNIRSSSSSSYVRPLDRGAYYYGDKENVDNY